MTPKPIEFDFTRIDAVRQRMLLRKQDMAELLGVSRMTYHRWVNEGGRVRGPKRQEFIRSRLRDLVSAAQAGWPPPGMKTEDPDERFRELLKLLP